MYQQVVVKKKINHPAHLIATICTCGVWAPFWLLWSAVKR